MNEQEQNASLNLVYYKFGETSLSAPTSNITLHSSNVSMQFYLKYL